MEKERIKKYCDKIEETLTECLDTYFEPLDLENIRDILRELKGEPKPPRLELTVNEIKLMDLIDEDDVLRECYIDYCDGRDFICTKHNAKLLEEVLGKEINALIYKVKRVL